MEHIPDNVYVDLYRSGVEDAFNALIERYQAKIIALVKKCYRQSYTFEDFHQIALIGFYSAVMKYEQNPECSFYTYAMRCMKNSLYDSSMRQPSKETIYELESTEIALVKEPPHRYIVSENETLTFQNDVQLTNMSFRRLLRQEGLYTEIEWACLALYLAEKKYTEIATELNIPVKTVDNALNRVRKKLRKHMEEPPEEKAYQLPNSRKNA